MNEETKGDSGAEEYVSITVETARPLDPAVEKNLVDEVRKIDGLLPESVHISKEAVALCYDPSKINQEQITALLKRAGVEAKALKADRAPYL